MKSKYVCKIYFLLFFTLIYASQSFANASLYYNDMDRLLNNSLAGKSIIKQLEKS